MSQPSEDHMEAAANALMRAITASRVKNADAGIQIIAAALANAEREGMRWAAEIAKRTAKYHLDASDMNLPVEPSPIIAKDRARVASGISDAIISEIGDHP